MFATSPKTGTNVGILQELLFARTSVHQENKTPGGTYFYWLPDCLKFELKDGQMKIGSTFLCLLLIVSCGNGKERAYTGSTPADAVIRSFLGIPLTDSVDFIRWKLMVGDKDYQLQCNYGIGKNNTNGFINGGRKIELKGSLKKDKNYYQLQNGDKTLNVAELNNNLLHLLNDDKTLLIGNGGWSYTLNNMAPSVSDQVNFGSNRSVLNDSIVFEGRTPCKIPGIIPAGVECYKLKWYIVFYANAGKNEPGGYKVYGTTWRKNGPRTGSWKIITGKNGRIVYQLNDDNSKAFLYLLKLDENILVFTDADGKLLVGDEDFSYTLNRSHKW
jgi:hypothetical protein